jgi:hypothetical protein
MRPFILLLAFLLPIFSFAQGDSAYMALLDSSWKTPSKESQAYHEFRFKSTTPPYGLAKVKSLISKIKKNDDDGSEILNPKLYQGLSLREKFTYHMIHAESYDQNCGGEPPVQDEQTKIFANTAGVFESEGETAIFWSDRQSNFFKNNRDTVITLIKESSQRSKHMGTNYKQVLIDINAKEMIPFIIDMYNTDKKDHDLLTLLMILMKDNKYAPFEASATYKKLYGDDAMYSSYINFNSANEQLIIKRATDFYNGLKK